ncbi:MAG: hypothetical protein HOO91_17180 [Bacteroidales bacterium]|nr:hypothetical protein [Bacteroidales bacterium]
MCYWIGTKKVRKAMEQRSKNQYPSEFNQQVNEAIVAMKDEFMEYYVAIGKGKPQITALVKENGKLQFHNMQWTLPYSYYDKKTSKVVTRELLNSTCERVFYQHKDIIFNHRCLIPIDGYFEYYHFRKETYPYFIQPKNGDLFYAGGIWNKKVDEQTGEISESFSIITTPPNPLVEKIHNNPDAPNGSRMLLLIKEDEALNYLNENLTIEEVKQFFKPYDEKEMTAHSVLRFQRKENSQFLNSSKVQEYFEYPELVA